MRSRVLIVLLAISTCLLLAVSVPIAVRILSLDRMRVATIDRLTYSGGTAKQQAELARIRAHISTAARSKLLVPEIVRVEAFVQENGFVIGVDWVSIFPMTDAVRFCFDDGTVCILPISEEDRIMYAEQRSGLLFFEASFHQEDFSEAAVASGLVRMESATLMNRGKTVSSTFAIGAF